ncbi:transposase [Streptosporangium sp. NPDC006007]|uniref:RNA-guided endonuclease InsQ/TnpB family protein n=1 Tax=Streptosporangium sp. NPDC006007 TaxID=3154575 RepID=UPI0033BD3D08
MSRFRLRPTPAQEAALAGHCGHARYVWNLAVEQHAHWKPGRKGAPGFAEQCRQLTEARAEFGWLRGGSIIVQQQALKDFAQAMANFFGGTHRRPAFRKRGRGEGFRVVAVKPGDVRRLSRHVGEVRVPKVGWVRFRWSRAKVKAAIARLKAREADRRKDWVEKASTGLARRFDVMAVENLKIRNMTRSARGTLAAPGRNVRQKAGLNRGILAAGWGRLVTRLEHKAPGRVRKINPRYTSRTCNACGHIAGESREGQALFLCVACGHRDNADVNAARNLRDTAAGHAVAARGGPPLGGPTNREPQPDLLLTV